MPVGTIVVAMSGANGFSCRFSHKLTRYIRFLISVSNLFLLYFFLSSYLNFVERTCIFVMKVMERKIPGLEIKLKLNLGACTQRVN